MPFIDGCPSRDTYLKDENINKKRAEKSGSCMSSLEYFFVKTAEVKRLKQNSEMCALYI